ncbi:MAG: type II secretion system protein [Gammaproteobacteria bacterium]|nr:type II secretion system protein [Gammaproteobacteria bacterium]NIR84554.1 type II secretion system protein [Gammaproteobacteria bacterium]NIR90457.1 type II secretion system protein [Gammaproteobacteria bacterium]NIU05605.1 type II secretion system protein [Gammaproteobacteria bacterium]NIV52744.1 prepilin-type N-terminal cleavage/methylation domain-containing protein [Gammaproteobacteria bacterium]
MSHTTRVRHRGFTLVELLIVVIILAILAAIVVPQFGASTEDARVATLKTDLAQLRDAIEIYYHQHDNNYPGAIKVDGSGPVSTVGEAQTAFVQQLTRYTSRSGEVSTVKDGTHRFGPYIKTNALPPNPFTVDDTVDQDVTVDTATDDITVASADPTPNDNTGWKFYLQTGRFIANDGQTLSDGTDTQDL